MNDETFAELVQRLEAGIAQIATLMTAVPAERWDTPLPHGEGGWTRRQLLAHMAANDQRQLTRVRVGTGIGGVADESTMKEQGDVHVWNQQQVDLRAGRSLEELLAEMRTQRTELVALLQSLTQEQRSRQIPLRGEQVPLSTLVSAVLDHFVQHAQEITE